MVTSEIEEVIAQKSFHDPVLDGEVMSANFQDPMKQVHLKTASSSDDAVLHLFDMCPCRLPKVFGTNPSLEAPVKAWVEQNASILKHVQALEWEEVDPSTTEGNKRFVDSQIKRL